MSDYKEIEWTTPDAERLYDLFLQKIYRKINTLDEITLDLQNPDVLIRKSTKGNYLVEELLNFIGEVPDEYIQAIIDSKYFDHAYFIVVQESERVAPATTSFLHPPHTSFIYEKIVASFKIEGKYPLISPYDLFHRLNTTNVWKDRISYSNDSFDLCCMAYAHISKTTKSSLYHMVENHLENKKSSTTDDNISDIKNIIEHLKTYNRYDNTQFWRNLISKDFLCRQQDREFSSYMSWSVDLEESLVISKFIGTRLPYYWLMNDIISSQASNEAKMHVIRFTDSVDTDLGISHEFIQMIRKLKNDKK